MEADFYVSSSVLRIWHIWSHLNHNNSARYIFFFFTFYFINKKNEVQNGFMQFTRFKHQISSRDANPNPKSIGLLSVLFQFHWEAEISECVENSVFRYQTFTFSLPCLETASGCLRAWQFSIWLLWIPAQTHMAATAPLKIVLSLANCPLLSISL